MEEDEYLGTLTAMSYTRASTYLELFACDIWRSILFWHTRYNEWIALELTFSGPE